VKPKSSKKDLVSIFDFSKDEIAALFKETRNLKEPVKKVSARMK